ncbi:MAG: CTP synthase [Verrucomicrobiota bacterium]|nr:CTP synthase [Verrucomicrobiota bacterium]
MKYIFVTGGVVSSLGKGLSAAALGTLLEARGLRVCLQKFDPYLNIDPGTMNPFEHGEVYVLDDGAETDLDLGHYERFTNRPLTRQNTLTSGQVYQSVLDKERRGDYLGKTVQVIPHVTDEIKHRIRALSKHKDIDVVITEIGGTTGDIEGLPFLEAIRQFGLEVGPERALFIHVSYVPYIKVACELKTKPTQQSVAKLREIGIQPAILLLRTEKPLDKKLRQKISLFCNVPYEAVIENLDAPHSIYEMPLMLQREKLDDIVCKYLRFDLPTPVLSEWQEIMRILVEPKHRVKIGVVGKYMGIQDTYKSIYESITHGGIANDCSIQMVQLDSEKIERDGPEKYLKGLSGIVVPGGFGDRGVEGKIIAAQYARVNKIPYLGLCLGMQIAVIEYARNVLGLEGANSIEMDPNTPHPVVHLLESQKVVTNKGASMRLGAWKATLDKHSKCFALYGTETITERHRHRYEFNNAYLEKFEKGGMIIAGVSVPNDLVELIELADHPFFVACQYHPEFKSKPNKAHPLFKGFITAALKSKNEDR